MYPKNRFTSRVLNRFPLKSIIPLAAQPRLLTLKNRYCRRGALRVSHVGGAFFTCLVMVALYCATVQTVQQFSHHTSAHAIIPLVINAALTALCMLVTVSSSVSAMSCLYMGHDIEIFLSSPLSSSALLRGKTCEVGICAAWIAVVFSSPLYLAIGVALHAHWLYFMLAPIILGLLLVLAVLTGMLLTVTVLALIPPKLTRLMLVLISATAVAILVTTLQLAPSLFAAVEQASHHPIPGFYAWFNQPLLPTYWIGLAIDSLRHGMAPVALVVGGSLLVCIATVWQVLSVAFARLHPRTYSTLKGAFGTRGQLFYRQYSQTISWCPERLRPMRALITREFFSFTRDLAHTVQLIMLLTISLIYLYNLKGITPPTHVSTTVLRLWDICLIFSSIGLSSIILLSICTRFVFPSVSLEGQALWLLQSAPTSARDILHAKYVGWYIPVACIAAVVFSAGGLSLGAEPIIIVCLVLVGAIVSHGLVALGLGIGARFARFDWEHPTEVSTSWGSLLYTITGLSLLALSMIPISLLFGLYLLFPEVFQYQRNLVLLLSCSLGSLWLLNFVVGRIGRRAGVKALEALQR